MYGARAGRSLLEARRGTSFFKSVKRAVRAGDRAAARLWLAGGRRRAAAALGAERRRLDAVRDQLQPAGGGRDDRRGPRRRLRAAEGARRAGDGAAVRRRWRRRSGLQPAGDGRAAEPADRRRRGVRPRASRPARRSPTATSSACGPPRRSPRRRGNSRVATSRGSLLSSTRIFENFACSPSWSLRTRHRRRARLPSSASRTAAASPRPTRACASNVAPPTCGVPTKPSHASSGLVGRQRLGLEDVGGVAAQRPRSAAAASASTTMPPRAMLTRCAPHGVPSAAACGMRASIEASTRAAVRSVSAQCTLTCVHAAKSSSGEACSRTPSAAAAAASARGECASTSMPSAVAARATPCAMRPKPRRPSRLPPSSKPASSALSHRPSRRPRSAVASCRVDASRCASVSSTTDAVDAPGVFSTHRPAAAAAARSMLSTPTPARPTTRNLPAAPAASASAPSVVAERMMTASCAARSDGSEIGSETTVAPPALSAASAAGAKPSVTRMDGEKAAGASTTRRSVLPVQSRRRGESSV